MEGEDRIRLLNKPDDGEYVITVSHQEALRVNGRCRIRMREGSCWQDDIRIGGSVERELPGTDYHCDVDFKAKVSPDYK